MDELLKILQDIVAAEHAQFMRYTYLSSLGYGLHTDALHCQFEEHALDEIEHAKRINHWIVDLGGIPPTDIPPVEQYIGSIEGAIEWILEAELVGIKKYNYAHELAIALGLPGLQSEIGNILEKEHEHTREMLNYVAPHMVSGDQVTMIMVANAFRRFAANGGEFFQHLIIDRFAEFLKRAVEYTETTWQELEQEQQAQQPQFQQYLTSALDNAMQAVTKQFPKDEDLLKVLPEESRKWLVQDVESQVRDLWTRRNLPDARSGIMFYKSLYEWLIAPDTVSNWEAVYNQYVPNWQQLFKSDWEQELAIEPGLQPSMEDIFQYIQDTGREPTKEVVEQAKEELQQVETPATTQQPSTEEPRRPIEPGIEKSLTIYDPITKKKDMKVGIGDTVFNQSARQILQQYVGSEEYPITRNQVNEYATGVIKEIRDDGSILIEVPGAEQPFDEQIWDSNDKLWGSRQEGQRLVQ